MVRLRFRDLEQEKVLASMIIYQFNRFPSAPNTRIVVMEHWPFGDWGCGDPGHRKGKGDASKIAQGRELRRLIEVLEHQSHESCPQPC